MAPNHAAGYATIVETVELGNMIKKYYKNNALIRDRRLQTKFESHNFSIFQVIGFFDSLVRRLPDFNEPAVSFSSGR